MWSTLLSVILIINEVMASNAGMEMSPATNFDSWIEVYNPGETDVNLGGMFLSVDANNPYQWQMPNNMGSVPAGGFKVIWLGSNEIKSNQAPFKLDCDGGTIILSDKTGDLITKQNYPEAMSRTAYARKTDGGNEWGWTATPTPEATNTTAIFANKRLDPPVVNQGSQLFRNTFTIQVEIPEGTTLRFTKDGSVPTASSAISTKGQFTINETTNYVFRLFQDGYLPSVPVTRSYIKTSDNYTIPVISIVGDERYFTDDMWGIDVVGKNGITGHGRENDPANWNQDWDRPVNFSYLNPDGQMLFNQDVNISISGGYTRQIFPRSMKLKSNKVFDGQNRFDFSFFPQKPYIRNKQLVLRNGGNDYWSNNARFMDGALETIIQRSGIDVDCQSYVPIIEYVNGKLRGVLNMREPNNDKYAYANFGYDDEELDAFENKTFKNGNDEAYKRLCQLGAKVNSDPNAYDEIRTLLDIDEFINYMAVEFYIGNDDWPENNVKAYRSTLDGRFRFISFDLDYAFNPWGRTIASSLSDYGPNGVKPVDMVILFLNLLKHEGFRKQFIDTFCIVAGSVFETERANSIVDELLANVKPMTDLMKQRDIRNYENRNVANDGHNPERSADKIKSSLNGRLSKMISNLKGVSSMKLSGVNEQTVTLAADAVGANLYVNGLQVPYAYFNGQLFAPVKLEAKAPAGYTFAGWKQNKTATKQIINLNDTWKYYDKGAAPNNWTATSFNDNSWSSGPAPLGYGMNGIKTTVSYGNDANNKHPTTYFRKTIRLESTPTRSDVFLLNYWIDDGFIIYVNGQEAARFQMPSGNVSFNDFSSTYAGDEPLTGSLNISSSLFKSGDNVIAVEIHNNKASSRDIFWAAEIFTTMGSASDGFVSTESVIDLPTDNTLSLVASFTPLSDAECAAQGLTPVRINEVSAQNSIYVNELFKRNDWLELYNTTSSPIDVEGMYLTNNLSKPTMYKITKGSTEASTVIPANGYLIIWCDKLEPESQLHASFKLDNNSGTLMLTAADESWSDQFAYTRHEGDQTVGRYPDGAAEVYVMNIPTIEKANIKTSYLVAVEQPNTTSIQGVRVNPANTNNAIYNLSGQRVDETYKGVVIRNGRKVIQ